MNPAADRGRGLLLRHACNQKPIKLPGLILVQHAPYEFGGDRGGLLVSDRINLQRPAAIELQNRPSHGRAKSVIINQDDALETASHLIANTMDRTHFATLTGPLVESTATYPAGAVLVPVRAGVGAKMATRGAPQARAYRRDLELVRQVLDEHIGLVVLSTGRARPVGNRCVSHGSTPSTARQATDV
jgi:hypothetical protein